MNITLEQIDILRKRANVSYKEAKDALEKNNGNMVEALTYLEEQNRIKPEGIKIGDSSFINSIKEVIQKLNKIKFVVSKDEKTVLNISSLLAILIGIFTFPVSLIILILIIITHHKIRLEKGDNKEWGINSKIDKVSNTVSSTTDKVIKEFKEL
ncbi:DUF4342 domain-containing protein [Acidilutibacter cellobiosedens]|uniref:DUF4342 domain-containing protein n=1 Tax=Acidilutibacter cellobiosedens TaxID=2507161 RepID=A0A410QGP2_9FIRM|nr:DUF4342 domain-containing protein [Acidilutibacter cellobiosedens]QAT63243.1 DUF4342 domain-containing protein [Acidilutibacter cellobiosedens]